MEEEGRRTPRQFFPPLPFSRRGGGGRPRKIIQFSERGEAATGSSSSPVFTVFNYAPPRLASPRSRARFVVAALLTKEPVSTDISRREEETRTTNADCTTVRVIQSRHIPRPSPFTADKSNPIFGQPFLLPRDGGWIRKCGNVSFRFDPRARYRMIVEGKGIRGRSGYVVYFGILVSWKI